MKTSRINALIYRKLPEGTWDALRAEFPGVDFRLAGPPDLTAVDMAWPEVVCGNVPTAWAVEASSLRWLQIVSSGIDDYMVMADSSVVVTTAHGIHASIIAQHVLMTVLMLERGQPFFDRAAQERKWTRRPDVPRRIEGRTLGLVGFGAMGREIARLAAPWGMRIVATKRTPPEVPVTGVERFYPWDELDSLLVEADHVVLALPLTPATRGVLDARRIARLKPGAFVHNPSRGGLLDEVALHAALLAGRVGGVALDTFGDEPLSPESPWWSAPHAIITPHVAGHHAELGEQVLERFRRNLHRYIAGEHVTPVADFARGY
ncbi:D-2-hydroxyacid dehydrogenase [Synoicihabitans lomoniglobus]|uniref:D-2-hydroxyacid dehydrogenase n=1 Tax=Synoicihabitans lomoniglobus TaxID=2909285 RepID=A0AAF0CNU5_9BACT|nr:D-2-hydroxyacid dehydrogenase [Opitutaceae bacterium LMO-M01]WED65061.1 D-2-hydroxyacid dehydrogenase [Opitutaceae bacterium LMO-M01]